MNSKVSAAFLRAVREMADSGYLSPESLLELNFDERRFLNNVQQSDAREMLGRDPKTNKPR